MTTHSRTLLAAYLLASATAASACSDGASRIVAPDTTQDSVRVSASTRWNQRGVALVVARPPASNAQAAVSRILTYLSLAQYRAVVAAQAAAGGSLPPSVSAAVGGASAVVLGSFFPLTSPPSRRS